MSALGCARALSDQGAPRAGRVISSLRGAVLATVAIGHVLLAGALLHAAARQDAAATSLAVVSVRLLNDSTAQAQPVAQIRTPQGRAQTVPVRREARAAAQLAQLTQPPMPPRIEERSEPLVMAALPAPQADAVAPSAPVPAAALAAPETTPTLQAQHGHCPPAPHPPALRERGVEGRVLLRVHVDAQGQAGDVRVVDGGSGWRLFDAAAVASALGCRFVPARRAGHAVESWVEFPVRFALRD